MFSLPLTSAENLAECRDTKSFSSWSRLQSIRFVSHERIPANQSKKGENTKYVALFTDHHLYIIIYTLRIQAIAPKKIQIKSMSKEGGIQIIKLSFRSFLYIELKPSITKFTLTKCHALLVHIQKSINVWKYPWNVLRLGVCANSLYDQWLARRETVLKRTFLEIRMKCYLPLNGKG